MPLREYDNTVHDEKQPRWKLPAQATQPDNATMTMTRRLTEGIVLLLLLTGGACNRQGQDSPGSRCDSPTPLA